MNRQAATSPTEAVQARHEVAQRVILPPNLPEALKNLHDDQLQLLLKDVSLEIERRKSAALPKAPPVEATPTVEKRKRSNPASMAGTDLDDGRGVPEGNSCDMPDGKERKNLVSNAQEALAPNDGPILFR